MIVTTGANGKLGRLVATALAERVSPTQVTLASRDPGKLADLAAKGFKTARANFDDPASLEQAFAGAEVALIVSGDAPNELRIRQHRAAIDAAQRAGVGRVAYTSFSNPSPRSLFPFAAIHADSEAYLRASGLPYTILRNNQYAENLDGPLANAKAKGVLALPGASGKVAHIARADIAAATAAVLTEDGHAGRTYELTGPEALDLYQVGSVLGAALGKPIQVVDAAPEDFAGILASMGLPPFLVEALVGIRAAAAAGEMAAVSDDAARLAGRPPLSLSDYVARAALG